MAGGEGTRLGHSGPKGTFPILGEKSLFELFAEKVRGRVAIMLSPKTEVATRAFFEEHGNFGIEPEFFVQGELPILDLEGNVVGMGPDGNGSLLRCFWESGIGPRWEREGVEIVSTALIDNPLGDPFDPELIEKVKGNDLVIRCTHRRDPSEKVGLLVQREGKWQVVEYMEVTDEESELANLSLYAMTMAFAKRAAALDLPIHRVPKGDLIRQERFIFDILPHAERVELLISPREKCFAPLKNREGQDSPETVRAALQSS
jgi:UDP-N-acetylglucosamine/UDP-N-acetylgalactosamine diphosphorylase